MAQTGQSSTALDLHAALAAKPIPEELRQKNISKIKMVAIAYVQKRPSLLSPHWRTLRLICVVFKAIQTTLNV